MTVTAASTISAGPNVTVSNGATVTYSAGSQITLLPGFQALPGSLFIAQILGEIQALQQTQVTSTSATIAWTALAGSVATSYYNIYRNGILIGMNGAGNVTFSDSSLNPNTAYTYSVSAVDSHGNAAATAVIKVNTPGPAGSLPSGYLVVLLGNTGSFLGVSNSWGLATVTPH